MIHAAPRCCRIRLRSVGRLADFLRRITRDTVGAIRRADGLLPHPTEVFGEATERLQAMGHDTVLDPFPARKD